MTCEWTNKSTEKTRVYRIGPSIYSDLVYDKDIEKERLLKNTVGTTG